MLADNAGNTVASYVFDAYGNRTEENTMHNPFRYCGEYMDSETGLIYLRNSYYDPSVGPIAAGGVVPVLQVKQNISRGDKQN